MGYRRRAHGGLCWTCRWPLCPCVRGKRPGIASNRLRPNSARRRRKLTISPLAQVFGPDAIQFCEIQAAGPQVSTLVNALLEGCFDNKFEVPADDAMVYPRVPPRCATI